MSTNTRATNSVDHEDLSSAADVTAAETLGEKLSGDTDTATNEGAEYGRDDAPERSRRRTHALAYGALGIAILAAAGGFGYLKWQSHQQSVTETARAETVRTAMDDAVAILSYRPESAEQELNAAKDLLTGDFRDEYTKLINEVVIPGATQNRVSAVVDIPAAASISATPDRAEVLLFVNQTTLFGDTPPSTTSSSVRITLERVGDRWLMSQFDPV